MIYKKFLQIFEKKAIKIEKRIRLVIAVIILSCTMVFSTFFYFDKAPIIVPVLFISSFLLTYIALLEDIEKAKWFGLFFTPVSLTIFSYLFYFLFPGRWLTRIPFIIIYAISLYAVLLCANIFNIGAEKNLQLYRAAFSVNFFYLTFLAFIIFNILLSLKSYFLLNMIIAGGVGFLLSLHLFWTIKLDKNLSNEVINYSLFVSIVLTELSALVGFIPLRVPIASLFLTASFYSLGGIVYNFIDKKLFKETIREYSFVWIFVLVILLLSIS